MNFIKSALVISTVGLSAITLSPQTVKAAIVNYNFQVDIDFGSLLGNTYNGTFSYDDSLIPPAPDLGGYKSILISSFNFTFEGNNYTAGDDLFASADFATFDSQFLGLNYTGSDLALISGSFTLNLDDAIFTYDLGIDGSGTGIITYTPTSNPNPISTPESNTVIGLLLLGSAMMVAKTRK